MGSENYKIIKNFITQEESNKVLLWAESLRNGIIDANYHLTEITKVLNGNSYIFDISQTEETQYITNYQKRDYVRSGKIPDFINKLIDRISEAINIPKNQVFLQVVDMDKGGKIAPHYDASLKDFINYKCNLCILSEDYNLFLDDSIIPVSQNDLYCFEASLYKHWTEKFNSRRVFLSFGFLLPYIVLNRDESDPRVRLSKRIQKYFQYK